MSETGGRKRASSEQEDAKPHKIKQARNGGPTSIHLKILVPSNMAGVVLGKGGETIIRIQEENNIKAHMSKSNEYFPGTTDRMCTLSGNETEGIKSGLNRICDRMFEKMDSLLEKLTLKILIPNATAGMIIGKGGEHIRAIKESTGAFVQLSRKNELPERCIIISGTKSEIGKAADELVDMIAKDPLSGSCVNMSYNSYTNDSVSQMSNMMSLRSSLLDYNDSGDDFDNRGSDLNFSFNFTCPKNPSSGYLPPNLMEYIEQLLRGGGYRQHAIDEITNAIAVLLRYGVLNNGAKGRPSLNSSFSSAFESYGNGFQRFSSRSNDDSDSFMLPSSFGEDDQGKYLSLQVSDQKVGSIMGTRGSTLTEIQQISKARVRVSKKEDYVDGTKDRIVYIYGGKKEMDLARSLIEWKVKEFDTKHSKR